LQKIPLDQRTCSSTSPFKVTELVVLEEARRHSAAVQLNGGKPPPQGLGFVAKTAAGKGPRHKPSPAYDQYPQDGNGVTPYIQELTLLRRTTASPTFVPKGPFFPTGFCAFFFRPILACICAVISWLGKQAAGHDRSGEGMNRYAQSPPKNVHRKRAKDSFREKGGGGGARDRTGQNAHADLVVIAGSTDTFPNLAF